MNTFIYFKMCFILTGNYEKIYFKKHEIMSAVQKNNHNVYIKFIFVNIHNILYICT